ncbi:MAG: hypothetical protein IT163_13060 [Bryobacterales bacterium]|nr:hypothetical protein [Bryobacterales bacterium]
MMPVDYWIERLEDPFETFAMVATTRSLGSLAQQQEEQRFSRAGPSGVSTRDYSVEDEHDIEVVEHLIGSAFVLAQATITQSVSIVRGMRLDAGCTGWIPNDRVKIMKAAAPLHTETGQSKIALVDDIANYYKHRAEWREQDLAGPSYKHQTMATAVQLGLGIRGYHNMEHALRQLEVYCPDMAPLADLVVCWRAALAQYIRELGRANGVPIRPRRPEEAAAAPPDDGT